MLVKGLLQLLDKNPAVVVRKLESSQIPVSALLDFGGEG